ncbi:MAG: DNA mismatch repair endonuclease MutH [Gammaproteobacteria bacterium]|nr:DNA mismatch repair endonuclease MutH [Gammaproteobacteria bacterium]
MYKIPPATESELRHRVRAVAGKTLGQLAAELGIKPPQNLRHNKGWQGQLLELALGTTASTLPVPDFVELGIELKTIPVNGAGLPVESTYVCTVPLSNTHDQTWETSWVKQKLSQVLWIPVESEVGIALTDRRIGQGLFWRPDAQQERVLREDWEELMDMVCLGQLEQITARHGRVLQIRPKAANARALTTTSDADGLTSQTLPRGFYLRSRFTRQILEQHYILPA